VSGKNQQTNQNQERVIANCNQLGFHPTKVLCGRTSYVCGDEGELLVRSVLLADVATEYSLALQDSGLGDYRLMGCGMLIPHKDTGAVN